jgi:N-acetylmuramoyl-L-alanine amidase
VVAGPIAVLAAAALGGLSPLPSLAQPADERFDTVVLDAGHGGEDEGARANRLVEKELVLDVAQRLRQPLEDAGLRVVMTRDRDELVPLGRRTAIASESGGDLLVSIHANAASVRAARGIEIFFLSLEASDDAARALAQRENAAFPDHPAPSGDDDPLVSILGDLAASEQMQESDEFARLLHEEFSALGPTPSRGVKQAPFVVLMGLPMPAVLVEIGFVTNPAEARALESEEQRARLAGALARAVLEFGRRYDARRGVAPEVAPGRPGSAAGGG